MRTSGILYASIICALGASLVGGCDTPSTTVVLANDYPPSTTNPFVIHGAFWQAVSFPTPISPGTATAPHDTVAASANTAYVVVAPGWNPTADGGAATPTSFIVLESLLGFDVHWNSTLRIAVDDATFVGNCDAQSFLTQPEADFITERVFASTFAGLHYDAATCTTTLVP
jgi:hypothetical protein